MPDDVSNTELAMHVEKHVEKTTTPEPPWWRDWRIGRAGQWVAILFFCYLGSLFLYVIAGVTLGFMGE
jgi:hypothetical protein